MVTDLRASSIKEEEEEEEVEFCLQLRIQFPTALISSHTVTDDF
jgi:hypothetical protein